MRPSRDGAEVAAILTRGDPDAATERAVHGLDAPEAARGRDLGDAGLGGLEQPARALDPLRLHVGRGRRADLPAEGAREVARTHARAPGERGHREIVAQVISDPRLHLAQTPPLAPLRGELHAELRLAARAA